MALLTTYLTTVTRKTGKKGNERMYNDELEEKRIEDFAKNTVIRLTLTVEQASEIYASLLFCAKNFRRLGVLDRAEDLERLARALMGE